MAYSFTVEEKKLIFTNEAEPITNTSESYGVENRSLGGMESVFSPLAASFHSRGNEMMNLMAQQEPRVGDIAPAAADIDDEILMNLRIDETESLFDDIDRSTRSTSNYFMGGGRPESVASTNIWGEGRFEGEEKFRSSTATKNDDMIDTFDFLVKSLSSANSYVSMLTREQLFVLRSIRPGLLYEFLQEVAKVRCEKRMRRAAPHECAFCKNNGENEECYSSHALKDGRGRVLCPVLRAFRCPRCGATGDRAHTIKYCPENGDHSSGSFTSRRREPFTASLIFGGNELNPQSSAPPTPSTSAASVNLPQTSNWNAFGLN